MKCIICKCDLEMEDTDKDNDEYMCQDCYEKSGVNLEDD